MNGKSRRAILASAGTVLVAGCVSDDDSGSPSDASTENSTTPTPTEGFDLDGAFDSTEADTPNETTVDDIDLDDESFDDERSGGGSTPETIVDETDTVLEDQYLYWEFTLNRETELTLRTTVRSGPRIDIIFTSTEEFDEFERGNRFRYNSDLSQMNTIGATTSVTFRSGNYVLIADNTSAGEASPPQNLDEDPARVDIELTGN